MSNRHAGFGLIEALVALALGLMVVTGASQMFVSAYQTWRLQGAALQLQSDARLVLKRMAQDIRMAGMFGCLRVRPEEFHSATAAAFFAQPVRVDSTGLSLVVAELPGHAGAPDWTLVTDCQAWTKVFDRRATAPAGAMAVAISRLDYRVVGKQLMLIRKGASQPLLDHVQRLQVALVDRQRIDLQLDLYEPQWQMTQRHALSVALRNPLPTP